MENPGSSAYVDIGPMRINNSCCINAWPFKQKFSGCVVVVVGDMAIKVISSRVQVRFLELILN